MTTTTYDNHTQDSNVQTQLSRVSRLHFEILRQLLGGPQTLSYLRKGVAGYTPTRQSFRSVVMTMKKNAYITCDGSHVELTPLGRSTWHLTLRHYVMFFVDEMRHAKFEVDSSNIDHLGVFALAACKAGQQLVARMDGDVFDPGADYASNWSIYLDQGYYLEPTGPLQFLNHSCDPNCSVVPFSRKTKNGTDRGARLVAIKDIHPGDELTFDYNCDAHEALPKMACKCNTSVCREWIVSAEDLPKFLELIGEERGSARRPDLLSLKADLRGRRNATRR